MQHEAALPTPTLHVMGVTMFAWRRWISIAMTLSAATGCVQQSYRVERAEAERLAALSPEERGRHVRALQGSVYSSDPSNGAEADGSDPEQIVITLNEDDLRLLAGAVVLSGRSSKNSSSDNDGAGSAAVALFVGAGLATTAVISVGVAEGVRHDGWLRLEPDAILLHIDEDGERTWLTLDELTPDLAASANQLLIYDFLDRAEKLERAPLNRVGFSYDVQMGVAGVNTTAGAKFPGFGWRGVLGYFPWQAAGFGVGLQFNYGRQVPSGESVADDALSYRIFGEFRSIPPRLASIASGSLRVRGLRTFAPRHKRRYRECRWLYRWRRLEPRTRLDHAPRGESSFGSWNHADA